MKYREIDTPLYEEIVEAVQGMGANALWGYICRRVPLLGQAANDNEVIADWPIRRSSNKHKAN